MSYRFVQVTGLLVAALWFSAPLARAQSISPETLATAKELLSTMNLADQFKALMPAIMQNMKAAVVQGRSDVERDYDAMTPVLLEGFQARLGELSEAVAIVYAGNFSADDLRALIAFYKTPTGQKFLQKTPVVMQQTMAAGQKFGQSVASELHQRMIDELRKKGHTL